MSNRFGHSSSSVMPHTGFFSPESSVTDGEFGARLTLGVSVTIEQNFALLVLFGRDFAVSQLPLQHRMRRLARAIAPAVRLPPAVANDNADQCEPKEPPEPMHTTHKMAPVVVHVNYPAPQEPIVEVSVNRALTRCNRARTSWATWATSGLRVICSTWLSERFMVVRSLRRRD
jgi:hypothetical protein